MQDNNWLELDFDEFEEHYEKKKSTKQKKRTWRDIEAYKEKQRERRELDMNEHYYSM